jgi:hypothetical protein
MRYIYICFESIDPITKEENHVFYSHIDMNMAISSVRIRAIDALEGTRYWIDVYYFEKGIHCRIDLGRGTKKEIARAVSKYII